MGADTLNRERSEAGGGVANGRFRFQCLARGARKEEEKSRGIPSGGNFMATPPGKETREDHDRSVNISSFHAKVALEKRHRRKYRGPCAHVQRLEGRTACRRSEESVLYLHSIRPEGGHVREGRAESDGAHRLGSNRRFLA